MRVILAMLLIAGAVAWIMYGDMGSLMAFIDRYIGP